MPLGTYVYFTKEPNTSGKEPYIPGKEPYISANEAV